MAESSELEFDIVHPTLVFNHDFEQIQALERDHFRSVFPQLDDDEIAHFGIASDRERWDHPNRAGMRGRYAHPQVALVHEGGELTHMVYAVDSASRPDGLVGALKAQFALRFPAPEARAHRYVRLREMIGPDEITLAAMTYHLLQARYYLKQPICDYSYQEEVALRTRLERWGLREDEGSREEVTIGEHGQTTTMSRHSNERVSRVTTSLALLRGVGDRGRELSRAMPPRQDPPFPSASHAGFLT